MRAARTTMSCSRTTNSNSIALESARTIDIQTFVAAESIDWIWYDTPYYLTPDDPIGEEAYCVIRDAMRATEMIGVSRLVLNRRERAVILKAARQWDCALDAALRRRSARRERVFRRNSRRETGRGAHAPDRRPHQVAQESLEPGHGRRSGASQVLDIIEAKKKGAKKAKAKPKADRRRRPPSNVINIMDALRRSVAGAKKPKGRSRTGGASALPRWLRPLALLLDRRRGRAEVRPRIGDRGEARGRVAGGEIGRSDFRASALPRRGASKRKRPARARVE